MEDSTTAMTVEFLRARLLSERSVSKSAKQRADELAKRVMELEEQLKVVTMQRKKAEKATVEVLEILENNGIDDFSESFDSNSDQEQGAYESKEDNNSMKEEENAMSSESKKSEVEGMSGLEREESFTSGLSLSWKRCTDSPKSLEKRKSMELRRQCSFLSFGDSSTKLRVGKSCRKNKHKQIILTENGDGNECVLHNAQENERASRSGNNSDYMNGAPENGKDFGSANSSDYMNEAPEDRTASVSGNDYGCMNDTPDNRTSSASGNSSEYMNDKPEIPKETNEETVLMIDQGSLKDEDIVDRDVNSNQRDSAMERYEAEENAQREWEEKFNEHNSHTQDMFGHANQSDIGEEREGISVIAESPVTVPSQEQEVELKGKETCETLPSDSHSTNCRDIVCSPEQPCSNNTSTEAQSDVAFSFPSQETPGANPKKSEEPELSEKQSTKRLSLQDYLSQEEEEPSSEVQNNLQIEIWQEKPKKPEEVLEALQRAKLSLKLELNKAPSAVDSTTIPNYYTGLFRVPTDFEHNAATHVSFPSLESKPSITQRSDPCSLNGSRESSLTPYFDPWMDSGKVLPPSSRFMCPYAELMPRMGFNGEAPKRFPDFRTGVLIGDRASIHSNHDRSNRHYRY